MNPFYTEVADRAAHCYEYCHAPELVFNFPFEIEHIIPLSKQGENAEDNLALACRSCNLRKGTRTGGVDPESNEDVNLFHPRQDQWEENFQIEISTGMIVGTTPTGRVTVACLDMNSEAQTIARQLWIQLGLFP